MVAIDEDALVCDLAETYHIYDYKSLSAKQAAAFSAGLREDSRIKIKMRGDRVSLPTLLAAMMYDRLSWLCWAQTKDGQKGRNRPESLAGRLNTPPKEPELEAFDSAVEYERRRAELIDPPKEVTKDDESKKINC